LISNGMKRLLTKKIFYIPATVLVLLVLYVSFKPKPAEYSFITVERGTIVSEVSITGNVKPIVSVELSFERSGRVASVPVKVGDIVAAGQTLLSLDATDSVLNLRQAEATLAADRAALAQLVRGTRSEDIAVLQSKETAARAALDDAKKSLVDKLRDAYTKADDAVRNSADKFFDNGRSPSAQVNIAVNDVQLKLNLNRDRVSLESLLVVWQQSAASLTIITTIASAPESNLTVATSETRANLTAVASFLDELSLAVNALTSAQGITQTTIDTYRAGISASRTAINTALSNVSSGVDAYHSAVYSLDLANKNLAVGLSGSAPEEIQAVEAKVLGDEANIDSMRHAVAVSSIRSPFGGMVTTQDGKIGQVVSANVPVVSVIGNSGFQIEANVPEADIAKLSVGNTATVTLDAYGSDTLFGALISKIDPAETLIDNVATYQVTFNFLAMDSRIRSGLTANIDVLSGEKVNVLVIPIRAVRDVSGSKVVRVKQGDTIIDRPVVLGLRGSNGEVEIVSGLTQGVSVAIPLK